MPAHARRFPSFRLARRAAPAAAAFLALAFARDARAWIHPEHREIAGIAIAQLDAPRRAALDALWAEARKGHEDRLCESPWAGAQGKKASCIDFAAWSALGGDHSCSADDLLASILTSDWVVPVARVSEELRERLAKATRSDQRRNALAWSDLRLEATDPGYSSRAGANNAHFLLGREEGDDAKAYLARSLAPGADLNAAGNFAYEHERALDLARGAAAAPPDSRADRARRILAAEAFGLHYLEDVFAAGHVAGTWGAAADRKGTHDYYDERGLEVVTWDGARAVILGDGWMRPEDIARTSRVVRESLEQLLDALSQPPSAAAAVLPGLETCRAKTVPGMTVSDDDARRLTALLEHTPVPGRSHGLGELPRFRSEIGPYLGVAGSGALAGSAGVPGYKDQGTTGSGTLSVGLRLGAGLDSLIGENADGLAFLEVGLLQQTRQEAVCDGCASNSLIAYAPGIPGRSGLHLRLRLPFWLIPGDLILAAPLLFVDAGLYKRMVIRAANGGLIPIETAIATPVGRFQFVFGREVGATFFGYVGGEDRFLTPYVVDGEFGVMPIAYKTIRWEFPVAEYRPFREFATRQAFTLLAQVGIGVEVPTSLKVQLGAGEVDVPASSSGFAYFRIVFDWRRYF